MSDEVPGRESEQEWTHRSIPRFDHETAQEWVEAIERSRKALELADQSGTIVDRELMQILDDSLWQTWFIGRALRNSVADDLRPRVTALEERGLWPRATRLAAQWRRRWRKASSTSQLEFMRLGDAPLDPPGPRR